MAVQKDSSELPLEISELDRQSTGITRELYFYKPAFFMNKSDK